MAIVLGERRLRGESGSFSKGDDLLSLDFWVSFMRVPSSLGLLRPWLLLNWPLLRPPKIDLVSPGP